ncbi:hypothetical protein CEB40_16220 (plasmid) [Lactiplantibacillus plantarum]|nr:hypothetical protein CEB40_16220 [Lactiplantibacillus plantarum]
MQANFVFEDGKGLIYMLLSPHRGHQPRIARFSSRSAGSKTTSRVVAITTTKEGCQVFDRHQRCNKDGKLTVTPKADTTAEYAGNPAKPTMPAPKPTVTKVVKLIQTGHHQTWFDRLVAWFK